MTNSQQYVHKNKRKKNVLNRTLGQETGALVDAPEIAQQSLLWFKKN